MRDRHLMDAEQLRGQANLDQKILEGAVSKLKSFDEAKRRYEHSHLSLMAQEHKYKIQMEALSEEIKVLDHDIESYEELKRAVKSYLSCSFDEALETISENSTRLVRSVPNMANATIQLMGVWETKEGKVKEEVNAVLNLDGDENIDIRSLCGGERSAIDLAVDLSVIELIENKTNKGINVFVLDEPFTGLDTVCIEMALEVLKNASPDKKLLIVDHNPIIKEFVNSSVITVVRDGNESKIL
jgi:DNA repair exonuclease SbcCD ATPase subunit